MKNHTNVVVAIISGTNGELLIAERPEGKYMAGVWEFPGGKVEPHEPLDAALIRELQEELGITPTAFSHLTTFDDDHNDHLITLSFWTVTAFTGEPHGAEGQVIRWVKPQELSNYTFPPANKPIIEHLLADITR